MADLKDRTKAGEVLTDLSDAVDRAEELGIHNAGDLPANDLIRTLQNNDGLRTLCLASDVEAVAKSIADWLYGYGRSGDFKETKATVQHWETELRHIVKEAREAS